MKALICLLVLLAGRSGKAYNTEDPNLRFENKKELTQVCVTYVADCNDNNSNQMPIPAYRKVIEHGLKTVIYSNEHRGAGRRGADIQTTTTNLSRQGRDQRQDNY